MHHRDMGLWLLGGGVILCIFHSDGSVLVLKHSWKMWCICSSTDVAQSLRTECFENVSSVYLCLWDVVAKWMKIFNIQQIWGTRACKWRVEIFVEGFCFFCMDELLHSHFLQCDLVLFYFDWVVWGDHRASWDRIGRM